jgi:hypothetical protein
MLDVKEQRVLQSTLPLIKREATATATLAAPPIHRLLKNWEMAVHAKCDAILANDLAGRPAWYAPELFRLIRDDQVLDEAKALGLLAHFRRVEDLVDDIVGVMSERATLTAPWVECVYGVAADFMVIEEAVYAAFPHLEPQDTPDIDDQVARDAERVIAGIEARKKH